MSSSKRAPAVAASYSTNIQRKNTPYAESMGRSATRYQITGYLVGPSYDTTKRQLIAVLENSDGAPLVDPYLATPKFVSASATRVTRDARARRLLHLRYVVYGSRQLPGIRSRKPIPAPPSIATRTRATSTAADNLNSYPDRRRACLALAGSVTHDLAISSLTKRSRLSTGCWTRL